LRARARAIEGLAAFGPNSKAIAAHPSLMLKGIMRVIASAAKDLEPLVAQGPGAAEASTDSNGRHDEDDEPLSRFEQLHPTYKDHPVILRVRSLGESAEALNAAVASAGTIVDCTSAIASGLIEVLEQNTGHPLPAGRHEQIGVALNSIAFQGWSVSVCLHEDAGWIRAPFAGDPNGPYQRAFASMSTFQPNELPDLPYFTLDNFRGLWATTVLEQAWGPTADAVEQALVQAGETALRMGYCLGEAEYEMSQRERPTA
jgi:hypothetical protein